MRLELELLGQRERLVEDFEEALFVGALVESVETLVEVGDAVAPRSNHVLLARPIHHERALHAVVVAAVDALQRETDAKLNELSITDRRAAYRRPPHPPATTGQHCVSVVIRVIQTLIGHCSRQNNKCTSPQQQQPHNMSPISLKHRPSLET